MKSNMEIAEIMKMLHPLSVTNKLEIISKLTSELKNDLSTKENKVNLLDELDGTWSGIGDEEINDIMNSRTSSERDINLE